MDIRDLKDPADIQHVARLKHSIRLPRRHTRKRLPLNRRKNNKPMECGHETRFLVAGRCLMCEILKEGR